jgi:DNA-binding NarL/FixJ family response regulator
MIHLSIIEKEPSFQKMFNDFFQTIGGYHIVEVYGHFAEMQLSTVKPKQLDIIILSINHKEEVPDSIGPLKKLHANVRIIISLASPDTTLIIECLKNHADGIVLKSDGLYPLHSAITSSLTNGIVLSPLLARKLVDALFFQENLSAPAFTLREKNIIGLLNEGLSYKQMANKLGITAFTINHHLKKIYKKAGVNSRSQLAVHLKNAQKPG